jgi:hypothetical protein
MQCPFLGLITTNRRTLVCIFLPSWFSRVVIVPFELFPSLPSPLGSDQRTLKTYIHTSALFHWHKYSSLSYLSELELKRAVDLIIFAVTNQQVSNLIWPQMMLTMVRGFSERRRIRGGDVCCVE